ncbi:MAG: hypothetical protein AAB460_00750 [Patescibacteria group bacterium]
MRSPSDNPFLANKSALRKEAEDDTRLARERQRAEEDTRKRQRKTVLQAELTHLKGDLTRKEREKDVLLREKNTHLHTQDRLRATVRVPTAGTHEQSEKERAVKTLQAELDRIHHEKDALTREEGSLDRVLRDFANKQDTSSSHAVSHGDLDLKDAEQAVATLEKELKELEREHLAKEHELSLARATLARATREEESALRHEKEGEKSQHLEEGKEKRTQVAREQLAHALIRLAGEERVLLEKIAAAKREVEEYARTLKDAERTKSKATEEERHESIVLGQEERKEEILTREITDIKNRIAEIEREVRSL